MSTFWEDFELMANPYDSKPLLSDKKSRELFIGREKELEKLGIMFRGGKEGIILIEGEVGIGKTSFVNIFQYDMYKKLKILPSFEKIELTKNVDPVNFMLSVFSNMIFNLEKSVGSSSLNKYPTHREAKALIVQSIDRGWGGSVTIAGFGGGLSSQQSKSTPPTMLLPTILNLMDKWIELVIEKTKFTSIIMAIDNLDIISDQDVMDFLNSMRDNLIGRRHVWWMIIGEKGLLSIIQKRAHRVSEVITGRPIVIEPLTESEINNMIQIRYRNLSKKNNTPLIVPKEIIKMLYEVSNGETRYILKQSTDLIYAFITDFPTIRKIPLQVARKMLFVDAQKHVLGANMTRRQYDLLALAAEICVFRLKDFKKFHLKSRQPLNGYLDKFLGHNFTSKKETVGKEVYYKTSEDVNIFYNKKIQKQCTNFKSG